MKATNAAKLRSNIQRTLRSIGTTNGTKLPTSIKNTGEVAMQYWLWSFVSTMADGMKKEATKAALKAGVIFDHKMTPDPDGSQRQVYNSDVVQVNVVVSNPSLALDQVALRANLSKLKLTHEQIDEAFDQSMKYNAAPHKFTAMLVEEQD